MPMVNRGLPKPPRRKPTQELGSWPQHAAKQFESRMLGGSRTQSGPRHLSNSRQAAAGQFAVWGWRRKPDPLADYVGAYTPPLPRGSIVPLYESGVISRISGMRSLR